MSSKKLLKTMAKVGLVGLAGTLAELESLRCTDISEYLEPTPVEQIEEPASKKQNEKPKAIEPYPTERFLLPKEEKLFAEETEPTNQIPGGYLNLNKLDYVTEFDHSKYGDPNNSGNRLFKVHANNLSEHVSEHFTLQELLRTNGPIEYGRIDSELVKGLESLREAIGNKPINVTSGYRSLKRQLQLISQGNQASKKSRHMSGDAVDIYVNGMSGRELAEKARELFPNAGIGIANTWIHLDFRGKRADWKYN